MLIKPFFSKYAMPVCINYIKLYLQICTDNNPKALSIDTYTADTIAQNKQMEDAFGYDKAHKETAELEALDLRRDNALIGIYKFSDAHLYHFDAKISYAADVVLHCINKYGKRIAKLELTKESEILDKIINDFTTNADMVKAITTLGLTAWVTELKDANNKFKDKFVERSKSAATKPSKSATELRPLVIESYENLFKQIDSRNNLDTKGSYTILVSQLNALTEKFNNNAKRGGGGSDNKNTGDNTPPKA